MYPIFTQIQLIRRAYSNELQEELLPHGISTSQWVVIRYLYESGPATFGDVAAYWQVEKPSITPIAQKLAEKELIFISSGEDKRKKVMHLSEKGKVLYEESRRTINDFQEALLDGISPEEREAAERVLGTVLLNLRKRG
ncbi:MAG: MarR family winged helix-turn-helix transcriptional regulator [Bacillus sp. (in: firmicutes)]